MGAEYSKSLVGWNFYSHKTNSQKGWTYLCRKETKYWSVYKGQIQ